jgi:hypothetical protein
LCDRGDEGVESSCGSFSQQRFELRKELFDEVCALGWRIAQRLAGSLDHLPDAGYLGTAQIVHDDDIAGRNAGLEESSCGAFRLGTAGRPHRHFASRARRIKAW